MTKMAFNRTGDGWCDWDYNGFHKSCVNFFFVSNIIIIIAIIIITLFRYIFMYAKQRDAGSYNFTCPTLAIVIVFTCGSTNLTSLKWHWNQWKPHVYNLKGSQHRDCEMFSFASNEAVVFTIIYNRTYYCCLTPVSRKHIFSAPQLPSTIAIYTCIQKCRLFMHVTAAPPPHPIPHPIPLFFISTIPHLLSLTSVLSSLICGRNSFSMRSSFFMMSSYVFL